MGVLTDIENELRLHRCAFTGHRPEKLTIPESQFVRALTTAIQDAIDDGFSTFISGMARGIDMIAAEVVLTQRKMNRDIKLIAASPYQGFEEHWGFLWRNRYQKILSQADLVKFISPAYAPGCFQARNEWMVDHSSRLIAVCNGESGGTRNTIAYAKQCNIPVELILF